MILPAESDLALKEWAVAINALARGEQVLILRKGGIHRADQDFRIVHSEFLLYPTYEHQKKTQLKNEHRQDIDQTLEDNDVPGIVTLTYWCHVTDKFQVTHQQILTEISQHHIWTDDYAQKRLYWKPKQPLTIALLRLYQLQQPQALPILDEYIGCKSWVQLCQYVPLGYMKPVLSDEEYHEKTEPIRRTLEPGPTTV